MTALTVKQGRILRSNQTFCARHDWWLNACVGKNGGPYSFAHYANGFFESATRLAEQLAENHLGIDTLVYPIAFNFRHGVELYIKHLNTVLPRLWSEQVPTEWTHKLNDNWRRVRPYLCREADFDPDHTLLPFVDRVIDDLLDIDPTGVVFRYPTAKDGAWYLQGVSLINVGNLAEAIEQTKEAFDWWDFTAGRLWDQLCESTC